jgi:hypothetical protein
MSMARTMIPENYQPRQTFTYTVHIPKVGARTRTVADGMVVEDDVVNRTKAYLYAMGLTQRYSRDPTPRRIRLDLTRTGIIP